MVYPLFFIRFSTYKSIGKRSTGERTCVLDAVDAHESPNSCASLPIHAVASVAHLAERVSVPPPIKCRGGAVLGELIFFIATHVTQRRSYIGFPLGEARVSPTICCVTRLVLEASISVVFSRCGFCSWYLRGQGIHSAKNTVRGGSSVGAVTASCAAVSSAPFASAKQVVETVSICEAVPGKHV